MNCTYNTCTRQIFAKKLCSRHYNQQRKGNLGITKEREMYGLEHTPEYEIWKAMKQRCFNPNNKDYKNYGGRGITVSTLWQNSFKTFIEDIGFRPHKKLTIERIDNDGNYELGNVRWADRVDQVANQRPRKVGASGHRHISFHKSKSRYRVRITHNSDMVYVGSFVNIEDAIVARDKYLKECIVNI